MTFQQPEINNFVTGGFQFARIKQYLATAGDIFELPTGAKAFVLGPDSDISRATVAYVNAVDVEDFVVAGSEPTTMAQITVTPDRAFEGFIPALNTETSFKPSGASKGVPGRILVWPAEIFDSSYRPSGFAAGNDTFVRENPIIDIVEYFREPGTLEPARSDKLYYYENLPFGADDCFLMIPFYGRRRATVNAVNTGANVMQVTMFGVNFRIDETTLASETQLDQDNVAAGAIGRQVLNAETDGFYDYLLFQFNPTGASNVSLRVNVSDR